MKTSSVISDVAAGTLVSNIFTVTPLTTNSVAASNPGTLTGSLSEDGKVLTLTAATAAKFNGRYDFNMAADKVEDLNGNKLGNYAEVITAKDTVKPTLVGTTYTNNTTAKVNFSEVINRTTASVTAKYADGTPVALNLLGLDSLTGEGKDITVTLGAVDTNKDILITFVGIEDMNGNLSSPNPITVTVKKDDSDKVKPAIETITPTSSTSFSIKFSEKVVKKAGFAGTDITVNTASTTPSNVTVDAKDASLVHVTGITSSGIDQIDVAAGAFLDLSGNPVDATTKLVNFKADTTKPVVASTEVKTINKAEYLVVNFNEEVNLKTGNAVFTTKKANGETATVTVAHTAMALHAPVNGKSKAIQIPLATLASGATYTADLDAALVDDNFGNANAVVKNLTVAVPGAVKVTQEMKAAAGNVTVVPASATVPANRVLKVEFKNELDVASAELASNYTVQGATVEKAVINQNSGGNYNVYLTLAQDSVKLDGSYEVSVKNVKAKDGLALENTYTENVSLTENVAPTVTGAKFVSAAGGSATGIELTFSEVVEATNADLNIFEVFVGGSTVAVPTANADLSSNTTNKATLTVSLTAAQIAQGITVKLNPTPTTTGTKVTDANDNVLKFDSIKAIY
ncbi:Ig-like domain-containing protein [Sporosarcina jeotgali]|uniref:Ig-like domain-containing protein n=1 Tax=Sporosarcina jeotgali TaxID=3020056 RepID=A0ABZ0KZH1_9BACL|nr:Ig-like domain-containing protein [Sporosarcina sp. B2O-1]